MKIEGKQTLSVLMTAMYVAKWESDDDNAHVMELAGSPEFARVFQDIADEIARLDADRVEAAEKWKQWGSIEQRPDQLERTRARIKRNAHAWRSWSNAEKEQMVAILLSPFGATQATIDELVAL